MGGSISRYCGLPAVLTLMVTLAAPGTLATAFAQSPISYPGNGQSLEQQAKDEAECRAWATQQTGIYPYQSPPQYYGNSYAPSGNIVRGAAGGAALGAVGGAIGGDAGKGAAIGAGVGATAGLLKNGRERRQQARASDESAAQYQAELNNYNNAFGACMQGRAYTVR